MPPEAARAALRLPDRALVEALARPRASEAALQDGPSRIRLDGGYVHLVADEEPSGVPQEPSGVPQKPSGAAQKPQKSPQPQDARPALPPQVAAGVQAVLADLAGAPFMAPEAGRLRELGLDGRAIAAAVRAGLLLRVAEQIVLAPGAQAQAAR